MPPRELHACVDMAQAVALAMKVSYGAAGITLRQNNEPAGCPLGPADRPEES
jgi:diadenosine tetraphosphate (Ap4A) HIT family hydrolase